VIFNFVKSFLSNLKLIGLVLALFVFLNASAQKYTTETGIISFFSDAAVEDIDAKNNAVGSIFDTSSGEIVFLVPIKDFQFDNRLMREHFNEKYMETHKYPKSSFKGRVQGFDPKKQGIQPVKVSGKLIIHGVTRDIEEHGTMEIVGGKVVAKSKFKVKLVDYAISVPQIVWQNIAEVIDVKIEFTYKPL
jgi:hypothetical protein